VIASQLAGPSGEGGPSKGKNFFFEKKKQKTFDFNTCASSPAYPMCGKGEGTKVSCFFFSKKKCLPLLVCFHPIARGRRPLGLTQYVDINIIESCQRPFHLKRRWRYAMGVCACMRNGRRARSHGGSMKPCARSG
jgi:hypothetical protein